MAGRPGVSGHLSVNNGFLIMGRDGFGALRFASDIFTSCKLYIEWLCVLLISKT